MESTIAIIVMQVGHRETPGKPNHYLVMYKNYIVKSVIVVVMKYGHIMLMIYVMIVMIGHVDVK